MRGGLVELSSFPPSRGRTVEGPSPSTVEHGAGRGHCPWKSFDYVRGMSLPCGASHQCGDGCGGAQRSVLMRRDAGGAADGGLAPVKGRTASEGRRPCPPRVPQRRKYKG